MNEVISRIVVSMSNNERKEFIYGILEIVNETPNHAELGKKITKYVKRMKD